MTILFIHQTTARSSSSLFFQLISGKCVPDNIWKSRRFRLKFSLRTLLFPVASIRYLAQLSRLPQKDNMISQQGLLPAKPHHRPFLRAVTDMAARSRAILDHYRFIASLNNLHLRQRRERICWRRCVVRMMRRFLFFPARPDREGEISLVLRYQTQIIASFSFSVINEGANPDYW